MTNPLKLVIFDLDGTLVDAYKAVSASLNHALTSCGYPEVDDYTIQRSVGWGEKVLIRKFVEPGHVERVHSVYRVHHKKALKSGTRFLPGAKELLDVLKENGYRLAIASNRPSAFTHIILKHLKVFKYFDMVVCADQVQNPKPAADVLEKIMAKNHLPNQDVFYVGDMTIDVETGSKAGIRTVAVLTGSSTKEEIAPHKPYRIIESLPQLCAILGVDEEKG